MRSIRLALVAALPCALGCGDGSPAPLPFHVAEGDNVLSLSVNGVHCAKGSYLNKPCVSVTVCAPGTADCQTIDDVLLDTGSFGLRVFKQVLTVSLPNVSSSGGGSLAECVHFADGTADWGPVATADVVLAKEPAVRVPIQVIDATFGAVPPSCPDPETEPTVLNGILGVGVFVEDCGVACAADPRNGTYYSSNGSTTSGAVAAVTSQVQNPVALLPVDNNGIIVALPAVDAAGAPAVEGAVVLGIGTRANNRPGPAATLALDGSGDFTTTVSGGAALPGSFVDTGSNGLFFAPPSPIPACTDHPEWFWRRRLRPGRRRRLAEGGVRLGAPLLPGTHRVPRSRGPALHPRHGSVRRLLGEAPCRRRLTGTSGSRTLRAPRRSPARAPGGTPWPPRSRRRGSRSGTSATRC